MLVTALVAGPALSARADPPPTDGGEDASFLVGAAKRDITPEGEVNLGGFGLGDGSVLPRELVGPGRKGASEGERIFARALVVAQGEQMLAFVITENIGMFVKYQDGPGLIDIARSIEQATGGAIVAEHVFAAGNHSHSAPDTLGAWGGVDTAYLQLIHDQSVAAVVEAYENRQPAEIVVGVADGRRKFPGTQGTYDLIDNQVCLETASNSFEGDNNGCTPRQESVDSDVRVLQARALVPASTGAEHSVRGCEGPGQHEGRTCATTGEVIASFVTYAAHPTLGGASGLHGDWPEYLSAALEATYGGVGIGWPGTIGRVQPERNWENRKRDYTANLMTLVDEALAGGAPVTDTTVTASKAFIRSEVTNVGLAGLLHAGDVIGAPLMRSREDPWLVGDIIQTVVGGARIGDVAFLGVPGEAYPQIALEAAAAIEGERTLFTLGLADDMLGYLISHSEDYPVIAALTPVNDNALFNITPRIGDHVMCTGIRMSREVGFPTTVTPVTARCPAFDLEDAVTGSDY